MFAKQTGHMAVIHTVAFAVTAKSLIYGKFIQLIFYKAY